MLIPENKHETKIKSFEKDLVDTKLTASIDAEMAALQKPYSEQMRAWAISAKVFGGLGLGFSFITEAGVIGWVAYGMVEGVTGQAIGVAVGVVVGVGVAGVIEWVKKHSNDNFWRVLVFGKRFEVARFVPVLLIGGVSLAASIYACTLLPAAKGKVSGELVFDQKKVDSLIAAKETEYLAAIAFEDSSFRASDTIHRAEILRIQNESASLITANANSKGRIRKDVVGTTTDMLASLQAERQTLDSIHRKRERKLEVNRNRLMKDKAAEHKMIREAETSRITQTKTEHETQGYFLAWASFFLELLFVTSSYFGMRYLHKCYLERNAKRNDNETLSLPIPQPLRNIQLPDIAAVTPAVTADNVSDSETPNVSDSDIIAQIAEIKDLAKEAVVKYQEILAERQQQQENLLQTAKDAKPQRAQIGFKTAVTADVTPAVTAKVNYILRVKEAEEKGLGLTIGGIYLCEWADCGKGFELNTYNKRFCSEACKLAARANKQQEAATNEK